MPGPYLGPWDYVEDLGAAGVTGFVVYHKAMPGLANDTVRYRGWVSQQSTLRQIRVYMNVVNTVGNYTLTITNIATGQTVLDAASFDMNTLTDDTVTGLVLTATPADLDFAASGRWLLELTSDNAGFNGVGIYFELVFESASGGGIFVEDLATTLTVGNVTGGTDIILTSGDRIRGEEGASLAGNVRLTGGTAVSGVAGGGNVILEPGAGVGGGNDGQVGVLGRGITYSQSPIPLTNASQGAIFISDGTGGLNADEPYFVPASNGTPVSLLSTSGGGAPFIHKNVVPLPNSTYRYEGWAATDSIVSAIRVYMETVNSNGAYTVTFTNEATGNTMLSTASFNMNTLTPGDVQTLVLTGTPSDLDFAAGDKWSVEFASNDAAFNGSGIYFDILWDASETVPVLNAAPDDDYSTDLAVFPNQTVNTFWFAPYNLTIIDIKVYAAVTPTTTGLYTLAVEDVDNSNNLLASATFDMETLVGGDPITSIPLTALTGDLDLSTGTQVRVTLVSDNGDLVAAGIYFQILYRSQSPTSIPVDDETVEMAVFPNQTVLHTYFAPYDLEVVGAKVYAQITPTTSGIYTLEVEDIDASNNLLAAASFDLTTLVGGDPITTIPLTGTAANLLIGEGTRIRFTLTSDNGDLVAAGIFVQLLFRSQ